LRLVGTRSLEHETTKIREGTKREKREGGALHGTQCTMRYPEVHSRFASYAFHLTAHALRVFALRAFAHLRDFVIQTFAMVGERP
jgi:hypothetical protein